MAEKKLKPGWRKVKFGDVVRLSKARCADPLAEGVERFVGLEHLEPGDLRIRTWGDVADGVTFTSVFKPGQVLFGKRRAYQRKVAVADFSGVCSGDIYVLESQDANVLMPELLPFICQTDAFFDHAVGTSAGSLSPRTNWTSLADFDFVLPPMDAQKAIAAVMAGIEETHQSLIEAERAGKLLYRSAIDDFFVSGIQSKSILLDRNSTAASGWRILTGEKMLQQGILLALQDGNHGSQYPRSEELGDTGMPYISASDISEDGEIDLSGVRRLTEGRARALRIPPALPGDVVLTHNATVGRVTVLPEWETAIVASTSTTYYRVAEKELMASILASYMRSSVFKSQLATYMRQSTRNQVPITTQQKLIFLVPPRKEQAAFDTKLNEIWSTYRSIKRRINVNACVRKSFAQEYLQ